mmetsp:Transcript_4486/g.6710  ORF Transcript_4486/g.6710 Transcript_4486/m.6710 type:complete len:256 (-) Transcript_4486:666-1433(-)
MARFASLGPEAREFANKAKTVGRCLDFFYNKITPPAFHELFSNMESLGKIREEEPEIGMPTIVDIKCRSWFQQKQEEKRLDFLACQPPKWKFMIELISLCVRHIRFDVPKSKLMDPTSTLDNFVSKEEAELFFNQAKYMKEFFVKANRIRSTNSLAEAMCHRVYSDETSLKELFETVIIGLHEYDYDSIRPFLGILFKLLDEPAFKAYRATWLSQFMAEVSANKIYFKWMEVLFEFIFRLVSRNLAARDWFSKHP